MKIKDNAILLAPASLHLPLYKEVLMQKGNCLNMQVVGMETYIKTQCEKRIPSKTELIFAYKNALQDLPEDNIFYNSRRDADFLQECLGFMQKVFLYGLDDLQNFPQQTQREISLYQIIARLLPIELWQKEARTLPFEEAKRMQILKREFSPEEQYWVNLLLSKGAKMLETKQQKERSSRVYYWSAANPRKEMEAAADAIVLNGLQADQVMIALEHPEQRRVLAQVLESRKIPYTFSSEEEQTRVFAMWKAAFEWLADKSEKNLQTYLRTFYPGGSSDFRRYRELFEKDPGLLQMEYRPNGLISQVQFENLQSLMRSITPWLIQEKKMHAWNMESVEQIGADIQACLPNPSRQDLQAFDQVQTAWQSVRKDIKTKEDLQLFAKCIGFMSVGKPAESISGVLVAGRQDISALYENTFYIGADAKSFAPKGASSIFPDAYLEKAGFPSPAKARMESQKQLLEVFDEPSSLYILSPQSDYAGKNIELSHEINVWSGMLPKFQNPPEISKSGTPDLALENGQAASLYLENGTLLKTRPSALRAYGTCPFKNLVRYGLQLQERTDREGELEIQPELFEIVMERGRTKYGRPFYELSEEQILAIVEEDFLFAKQVFSDRSARIDRMAREYAAKAKRAFDKLQKLAAKGNYTLALQAYKMHSTLEENGKTLEVEGAVESSWKDNLVLGIEKRNGTGIKEEDTEGILSFSLSESAKKRAAYKPSYKGASGKAARNRMEDDLEAVQNDFYKKNLTGKDAAAFDLFSKDLPKQALKAENTYTNRETKIMEEAKTMMENIETGTLMPVHDKDACSKCAYRSICRNAAREK
jgi:hypothetical protein